MRPTHHFTVATGWMNDPHGVVATPDGYHAFFQHVPGTPPTHTPDVRWGHARGADLLGLTELPVALEPGDGDDGIWTGSLVLDDEGAPRIFYTSITMPGPDIARIRTAALADPSDPAWVAWTKGEFVVDAPDDVDLLAFRDPCVRREADGWRMTVGGGDRAGNGLALTWTSPDLERWTYRGILASRSREDRVGVWMGGVWECPQLLDVGGTTALIASGWDSHEIHHVGYAVGALEGDRLVDETWHQLSHGDGPYAPTVFRDADGEPAVLFWLRGVADEAAGWASALSVPYRIALTDGRLTITPHPDVDAHHGPDATDGRVPGAVVDVAWEPGDGEELTVADASEPTLALVTLRRDGDHVVVTTASDSRDSGPSTALPLGPVRLILDGPALEVSTGWGLCSGAVTPTGAGLHVTSTGALPRVRPLV